MSVRGIAAGPDQIADETNLDQLASVDVDGNLSAIAKAVDSGGQAVSAKSGNETELLRQNLMVSRAILLVLANAFHPGTDPQSFIDAMSDEVD